jgi:flagellar FliJ protein
MGFKFPLNAVLKHRKRLEEVAQKEYAEARQAVEDCLRAIEAMYQRMDEVRAEISDAEKQGSREKMQEILQMDNFLHGQKIRIETLRLHARQLLATAEEKQEALVLAAQEKKVLVKLKEKRLKEYHQWLREIETKNLDEQNMMRQFRRAR